MALLRQFVFVAAILLLAGWTLGVGRFSWSFLEHVFSVVNFPWSVPFLWLEVYRLRVLGQWFDGIRFYAAASSPRRSRRTWAGLR